VWTIKKKYNEAQTRETARERHVTAIEKRSTAHGSHQNDQTSSSPDTWRPVWFCGRWSPEARSPSPRYREPWSSLPSWGRYGRTARRWSCPAVGHRLPPPRTPGGWCLWSALELWTSAVRRCTTHRLRFGRCGSDTRRRSSWRIRLFQAFWTWPPAAPLHRRPLEKQRERPETISRRTAAQHQYTSVLFQWCAGVTRSPEPIGSSESDRCDLSMRCSCVWITRRLQQLNQPSRATQSTLFNCCKQVVKKATLRNGQRFNVTWAVCSRCQHTREQHLQNTSVHKHKLPFEH